MFLVLPLRLAARRALIACSLLSGLASLVFSQTPSAADGFNPDVDGNVYVLVTQADGKVLVGGQFTTIRGEYRNNLARLNADGSLDTAFNPNPNGVVRAAVIQPDGRIVIGGDFTALQPGATAVTRNRIARLEPSGAIDSTFTLGLGGALPPQVALQSQVHALLLQPDGRIVAGGTFTTVQSGTASVTRNRIARFNANGTLDTGFDPNANGMVLALALHVDGKILVGGGFTTLHSANDASPTSRNRIARLNPNGTVDSEFDPNANNGVTAIAVQRDGKIVLGGHFTTLHPIGDDNPSTRTHLGRVQSDGTLDYEFVANVNGAVAEIAVQPDGGILVGGTFNTAWGRGAASATRNNLARFTTDGSLDSNFNLNFNAQVDALAFQADGRILVGGYFTRVLPPGAVSAIVRNRLARLTPDGSVDSSFEIDAGGRVLASAVQSDGKILIAGSFTNVGGATHNYFARLNADGSVDATYNPDFNERVFTIAIQSDGKAIVGGSFTTIGGETRNHIARLNPNGTIDSAFNPSIDGQVGVIALQPDGRILVGGTFTGVQAVGAATPVSRPNLLRLTAAGALDDTFNPSPNSSVAAMVVQSDGKILLGGAFSTLTPTGANSPTQRSFIARINSDGTLDAAFSPTINARVSALAVQSDGKIVLAGAFTAFRATDTTDTIVRNHIARLNGDGTLDAGYDPNANDNVLALALQPDGRLIIGGSFTTLREPGAPDWILRKYAARLNTDGTVDSTFDLDLSEAPGNRVDSLRLLADGRLLIGGSFTSLQPTNTPSRIARKNFARINANGTVDTAFNAGAGGTSRGQINAVAVQPDNKIIAVGSFSDLGGAKTTNIARFNAEGSADPTFSSSAASDGPIHAVATLPNASPVPAPVAGFAWLNRDGTLRTAFSGRGARLGGQISAAVVHPNGGLLLGGAFTNLANTTGGNLVRFNRDGSLDANFNPSPNGAVSVIAIQPDGRILIAGSFSVVHGVARNRIARLNADGSLDTGFDPNAGGNINALVLEADGRMIVGGAFTTFTPNATTTPVTRNFIARLNSDGTVDANYNPNVNAAVFALVLQGDGKVFAGGTFTTTQPNTTTTAVTRNGLARFNTDGTLDTNFDPNSTGPVYALAMQPNSQLVAGGSFSGFQPTLPGGSSSFVTRNNIARINSDGSVDADFDPNANRPVRALAVQPDGSVLLAGEFTTLQPASAPASIARHHLARVNSDGSLDAGFNPDVTGNVFGLAALADGTVLVSGDFTGLQLNGSIFVGGDFATLGGITVRNLAALTYNGSVTTSFQPNPNGAVNALLAQPDGKIVVAGAFTSIAGATRNRLARFNADGTIDTAFNPTLTGTVNALALQPDGKLLVGGAFTGASSLVRLNADGSADAAFAATAPGPVTAVAAHHNGKIFYVTNRTTLAALNSTGAAADPAIAVAPGDGAFQTLSVQGDGSIIVGGNGTISATGSGSSSRPFLARIGADGRMDLSFTPAPNGAVTAVAIQSDGRVVVGGAFTTIGGEIRHGIARLAPAGPATQALGVTSDGRAATWVRTGTAGEVSAVIFELSTDGATWTTLGLAIPSAGTWTLSGLSLPAREVFYVRARGIAVASGGTSSGVFELVREFNLASASFAPVAGGSGGTPTGGFSINPFTGIISGTLPSPVRPPGAASIVSASGDTIEIVVASATSGGTAQLTNLSTRGRVSAANPLILGFAITGTESRPVLMRAVGPALTDFGVSDALRGTRLQVYDSTGALVTSNESWTAADDLVNATARTGAFPLAAGSADSAAVVTLNPGIYTMQVVDTRGTGGVALAEIYDAGNGSGSRLVNVSSRGGAGAGDAALISGFVISGDAPKRVLLRAVGPTLAQFGAGAVVADPSLSLYNSLGVSLGSNDNWVSGVAQITTAALSAGAFALEPGSKDAAVIATLPPGAYTIQVSTKSDITATALLEIYEVP
ncbi:MAG: delta-60 repeat domain-containing protein [Opitutaceae bacterium]|nr:delta-60 repeat domain-containing protein [Opitutaceae bacterium]